MTALHDAAVNYAQRGWRVFPLKPNDKRPLIPESKGGHGVHDATTDLGMISNWWAKSPRANIGIACGGSGLFAVDLDVKDDDGISEWRRLAGSLGFSENGTLTNITASGGRHRVYTMPEPPLGNTQRPKTVAPGVETRGDGGYIVAPPSVINGKRYTWEDESATPLPCPSALADALRKLKETEAPAHPWAAQRVTLAEMLATDPPPVRWLVPGLLEAQVLAVLYGKAGSLKSMLMAYLALCVASGREWLPPVPGRNDVNGRNVQPNGVVWVNLDNGAAINHRRFVSLARAHGITDAPIAVFNFPNLDLTLPGSVIELRDAIVAERAGLVVIDTFINAASVRNENDNAEISVPMFALRKLIEQTGATIVLIHHPNKTSAANDSHDDLRGGSAIIGAVDTALRVVRPDPKQDSITVTATKSRNAPVSPLAALWTYDRNTNGDLATGTFYGLPFETNAEKAADELQGRIMAALAGGPMNTSDLLDEVGTQKARLLAGLRELAARGRVSVKDGPRGAKLYDLCAK